MSGVIMQFMKPTYYPTPNEILGNIRNTIILKYLIDKEYQLVNLETYIEGTQYGYNASAMLSGRNKFLRITDIKGGGVNWNTVPFCNCKGEESYLLQRNDILIARTGTAGKCFKINEDTPRGAIFAGYLIRIRAKKDVNPDYIYLFLNSYLYWPQIMGLNERSFRAKANAENLKALLLPNCPKDIQDDMVKISQGVIVEGYEDLIEEINRILISYSKTQSIEKILQDQVNHISHLNYAILKEAIQGALVEQYETDEPTIDLLNRIKEEKLKIGKKQKFLTPIRAEEIPFNIPRSWSWCKIDDLVLDYKNDVRTGPFGTALNKGEHQISGVPVWGIESISKDGRFTNRNKIYVTKEKAKELKSFGVKGGDLIISRSGTIGELCMLPYNIQYGILSTNLMKISVNRSVILPEYFCHIIKGGIYIKKALTELCSGSTRLFITQSILSKLVFPVPPLDEQRRIIAEIERQIVKTDQLKELGLVNQRYNDKLREALLSEAFQPKSDIRQASIVETVDKENVHLINLGYHKTLILAAEIVSQLYQQTTFGHLKLQKLIYLCQKTTGMKLSTNFLRQAMGPYDPVLMRSLDAELKENGWFEYQQTELLKYKRLDKVGGHKADFNNYFLQEANEIQFLIDNFKTLKSEIIEIVATLYSCLETILESKTIYSEPLLLQKFYAWSNEKVKFEKKQVKRVFQRMIEIGLVPKKFKPTDGVS